MIRNAAPSSDPLPCPHCAGTDIRFDCHRDYRSPTGEIWSMCCCTCGATFPNRYREQLLVEAWNRRSALTAPETLRWQPIATAPKDGGPVILGWLPNGIVEFKVQSTWKNNRWEGNWTPTHWIFDLNKKKEIHQS